LSVVFDTGREPRQCVAGSVMGIRISERNNQSLSCVSLCGDGPQRNPKRLSGSS
jgi:hypothetical protein